jgi:hypothetical protein
MWHIFTSTNNTTNFYFKDFKNMLYAGVCLFTLGRHGNFTAGVTLEQPDLLCTALRVIVDYYQLFNIMFDKSAPPSC